MMTPLIDPLVDAIVALAILAIVGGVFVAALIVIGLTQAGWRRAGDE